MPASPNRKRCLARAGWSIVGPSHSPEPGAPEFNALGKKLVSEVAASWTKKYKFTIMQLGSDGQSAFHYECIFSLPINDLPVPSFVLSTRFAFVVPSAGADPRLLYSFEEGDLRHEWALVRGASGEWQASRGQQYVSLGDGRFEQYMDRVVHEKEQVRDRGVNLTTSFEVPRLGKPPAISEASSECSGDEAQNVWKSEADEDPAVVTFGGSAPASRLGTAGSVSNPVGVVDTAAQLVMCEAMQAAGLYCDKVEPPASLADLLASIFDAADEDNIGELPHYEVARLLSATLPGFSLELWDIHLLMTSAQENDDGFIECKPFIQVAPEIIHALRKRRMAYRSRGLPGVEVPQEAVKHCFTDEVTATANQLMKTIEQCTQEDPSCGKWRRREAKEDAAHKGRQGRRHSSCSAVNNDSSASKQSAGFSNDGAGSDEALVGIKRRFCHDCLASLPERLSPQETMRLMQMLPEDEDGFIMTDELVEYLEHLRTDAMLNALVESDVLSLRTHLVLGFRRLGLSESGKLNLWTIKTALLLADQICLTRLQIHVLLCLAKPDSFGNVDIAEFLGTCCTIIPHMFDAKLFVETAERLILEHAESMRRAENEELAALGAARVGQAGQEGEESQEKVEVDPETVEKTLQQILTLNDDAHRTPPALPPETIYNILGVNEKEIQGIQLTTSEVTGFAAEMMPDAEGFVPYVEHIKKWVPIIFEQRKDQLLNRYLELNSYETLGIPEPDLQRMEIMFPLLPFDAMAAKARGAGSGRRSSRSQTRRSSCSGAFAGGSKSLLSDAPSHSKADSKGGLAGRVDSKDGHHSAAHSKKSLASRRLSSKTMFHHDQVTAHKEPPPGRGYQRRKDRIAAMEPEELVRTKSHGSAGHHEAMVRTKSHGQL